MSAAAVRHHLGVLAEDGRVVEEEPVKLKRGRPQKLYRLSERMLGDNLGMLADATLEALVGCTPIADREAVILRVATTLDERMGAASPKLSAAKQVIDLTERLSALSYQASWEAGAHGPRVVLGHCPYAAIIERHPELCRMDAEVIGRRLGSRAEQILKMEPRPGGPSRCVFAIGGGEGTKENEAG